MHLRQVSMLGLDSFIYIEWVRNIFNLHEFVIRQIGVGISFANKSCSKMFTQSRYFRHQTFASFIYDVDFLKQIFCDPPVNYLQK